MIFFMNPSVTLYSNKKNEIKKFLDAFYEDDIKLSDPLTWKKEFKNAIDIANILGAFIDNNYKYDINMWICLDKNFFINVTEYNAEQIIRYLFERYPY
jgi:hypothetical protein